MRVSVLLFEAGTNSEGIHSLELKGNTVILMFEDTDDAQRYCGLLEAQDFPKPTVEELMREEIEKFCDDSGYEARFVPRGFIPSTEEERLMISPPESNLDVSSWDDLKLEEKSKTSIDKIEDIRKRLEDLL